MKKRQGKVSTPATKRLKGDFKQFKNHSDKITDYKYDKSPSNYAKAKSPEPENRADIELRKMVSKNGISPADPGHFQKTKTNSKRYDWGKSGPGRKP